MKIINYTVVKADKHFDLTAAVHEYMREGWVPFGGASVGGAGRQHSDNIYFIQSMVKYAKEES